MTGLCCGNESAAKCRRGISDFFPADLVLKQGYFLAPSFFSTIWMDWVLDIVLHKSRRVEHI